MCTRSFPYFLNEGRKSCMRAGIKQKKKGGRKNEIFCGKMFYYNRNTQKNDDSSTQSC